MEDRQTHLEELLAHQGRLIEELNGVVTTQHDKIDALRREQDRLKRTVDRLVEFYEGAEGGADERPPHY